MAEDPDDPFARLKETRGRRSKSLKKRDLAALVSSSSELIRSLPKAVDFAMAAGYVGYLAWATRLAVVPVPGSAPILVQTKDRTGSAWFTPMWRGKGIGELHLVHPDAPMAESLGTLAIALSVPGAGLLELAETLVVIGIYHALFNGFKINVPTGVSADIATFDPGPFTRLFSWLLGQPIESSTTTATVDIPGLFPSKALRLADLTLIAQRFVDSGRLAIKVGQDISTPFNLEPYVIEMALRRGLASWGHAGFVYILTKRGLGGLAGGP